MPRSSRSYGRPGTAVIPPQWGSSHAPVAQGAATAVVNLRKPGGTTGWDEEKQQTTTVPFTPYASDQPARVQAQRETAVTNPADVAEETIRVSGYLVTLPIDIDGIGVGDQIDVTASDDPLLTGQTLQIVDIVRGSLRFERDVFATLNQ